MRQDLIRIICDTKNVTNAVILTHNIDFVFFSVGCDSGPGKVRITGAHDFCRRRVCRSDLSVSAPYPQRPWFTIPGRPCGDEKGVLCSIPRRFFFLVQRQLLCW